MTEQFLVAEDIPWGLPPAPRPVQSPSLDVSTGDALGLMYADHVALETHLASVEADLVSYRELVHVALDRLSALTVTLRRQQERLLDQSRQIRELMHPEQRGKDGGRG